MSQFFTRKTSSFAILALILCCNSELSAQRFGGNRGSFSARSFLPQPRVALPQIAVPRLAVPRLTGQIRNLRSNQQFQTYARPTYSQPPCDHSQHPCTSPVYPQPIKSYPIVNQPVYSQPVVSRPVVSQPQPTRPLSSLELTRKYTSEAKVLFQQRRYTQAKLKLNEVVKRAPKDTNAYQFRALNEFAQDKFETAAADAFDALSLGNTWTREVLKSVYGPRALSDYDNQLAKLERAVKQQPSMQRHFLLAYHYLVNENWAKGKVQLENVLALQPQEPLSQKLLAAVDAKLASRPSDVAQR